MTKIQPIKADYDHSNLVNSPPFITNYPLIEPQKRVMREIVIANKENFHQEYSKQKQKNAFIWSWLLLTFGAIILATKHAYKKIKAALF